MNRRELLTGAAMLAGAGQANAFGIGKLGANFGRGGSLGGVRSSTPVTPFSITKTDNAEDATSQTTYTWAGRNFAIGPADSTRLICADITARQAGTAGALTGVTIGGVVAAKIDESPNTNTSNLTITSRWQAAVPFGTTATVSATFNSAMLRAACVVHSILGSNGVAPSGSATANFSGTSASNIATGTITVPSGGGSIIAGAVTTVTGGVPTITPTNYTTDLGATAWGISYYSAGKDIGNYGSRTYTMTWGGTTATITTGVFSAWAPLVAPVSTLLLKDRSAAQLNDRAGSPISTRV